MSVDSSAPPVQHPSVRRASAPDGPPSLARFVWDSVRALFLFTKAILAGEPIRIFNHGRMRRDFTYIDDIVEGVIRVLDRPAAPDPTFDPADPDPSTSSSPYRVFNIGNDQPTELLRYVEVLEEALGVQAVKQLEDIQPGDVPATWADVDALRDAVGFAPATPVEDGVRRFVAWYREFYG